MACQNSYLPLIIDCFDGMVVGWTIGMSPGVDLVNTAIETVTDTADRPVVHSVCGGQATRISRDAIASRFVRRAPKDCLAQRSRRVSDRLADYQTY